MRVLLVRTSAMGDIVHCLPVLQALRRARPDVTVGWVAEAVWSRLLDGHPSIDSLIRVRTKAWRRNWLAADHRAEIADAVGAMRAFRPDVAIDLMGNFKGALLARLSKAPRVIGARREDRREAASARLMTETVATPGPHAIDRALSLLAPLGIESPSPIDLGGSDLLVEPPEAKRPALDALDADPRPLVLIQAGAGWVNKQYPVAWWGEVACALVADGCDVAVLSAPGEEALAASVAAAADGRARIIDATDFAFFAALCRRAALLLGGDTGPLHLAHALGTPVVSLIGPTDPERNGPYGALDRVLFHELPCSRCYKRFDGPRACLLSIPPRTVVERAREVLAAH
ncbi:MAG: glycosyltransferase family 9 protein [Acidobacteriota bacterium]